MIRNKFISLALWLFLLSVAALLAEKQIVSSQLESQQFAAQAERATIMSRISLLVADLSERQKTSSLLNQLDSIPEIAFWQLIDSDNSLISEKTIPFQSRQTPQYLYFYGDDERQRLLTLKIYFKPWSANGSMISWPEIILLVGAVSLFLMVFYYLFKPLDELEEYSRYLLANNKDPQKLRLSKITNPISQVINQLLLKNSLLLKDKLDLTEQIRKISYVDEVTELGNQLFFKAEFQVRLFNQGEDESGLLMLVSFNDMEDTQERVLTDENLKAIADLLRQFIEDIPSALVARLRDNDFAILLPNQSKEQTNKICKKLISQLEKSVFDKTPLKEDFVDIGISAYKKGFDYSRIISEADMALRNAQLQGGNNWFMFGEVLPDSKVRGLMRWRSFLEQVLDRHQLQLYSQQIVLFNDEKVQLREVLARIEDGKEVLNAETFLPMANQCGLAAEFDRQVVDRIIKHCLFEEKVNEQHRFSINLFVSSLLDERFVGWLIGKLSCYPALASQFAFEISEKHINHHLSAIAPVMNQLTELGIKWCVERFGSPEEDLAFLEVLPIHSVKIDRRITFDIHKDKSKQLLLQSLLINLKSFGIQSIAEGVEGEEEAAYMQISGVDGAQGFFYSKPQKMKPQNELLKVV